MRLSLFIMIIMAYYWSGRRKLFYGSEKGERGGGLMIKSDDKKF